jgi:hypothetical protein
LQRMASYRRGWLLCSTAKSAELCLDVRCIVVGASKIRE